ncbi:MAG: hypothetical protein WCD37_06595 [Chloroflexia bacterium]
MHRLFVALLLLVALIPYGRPAQAQTLALAWPTEWQADRAIFDAWARADGPLAMQAANRSWVWGPVPFAVANEPYAESPTGLRLVEYLDKGRMEVNDPTADRSSPWFVTSGLLVNEMVTGQAQTGNSSFESRSPANVPVSGDAGSLEAPTYASFAAHTAPVPALIGKPLSNRISHDGALSPFTLSGDPRPFTIAYYDEVSKHNVPAAFSDWMAQSGPVLENGRITEGRLLDPLYVLGRPITEAYWADVLVGGKPATVLIQLYERRALTYNPGNPPEWRVEMANVGRAYYDWRYSDTSPTPAIAAEVASNGISFRGYNWPSSAEVRMEIKLAGADTSLLGPVDITADNTGRFAALLLPTSPLMSAVQSGAYLRARAKAGGISVALPFDGDPLAATTEFAGTLVGMESANTTGSHTLTIRDLDGTHWRVQFRNGTRLSYNDGTPANTALLDVGVHLSIKSKPSVDGLTATSATLLSISSSNAWIGYEWKQDGKHLLVSGAGWPRQTVVFFSHEPPFYPPRDPSEGIVDFGPPEPFASLTTDSRGNLQGSIEVAAYSGTRWLLADSQEDVRLYTPLAHADKPGQIAPPQLAIMGQAGAQLAYRGSYCWAKQCYEAPGVSLPTFALDTHPDETLTFRSQYGPDPHAGLTPQTYSADLYPLPGDLYLPLDKSFMFTPQSQPIYSAHNLPGRPFSLALPQGLPTGVYALVVTVTWPDPSGGTSNVTYGLVLHVE